MSKKKIGDGVRMVVIAVLSIVLFGGMFSIVTDSVFAASMKKTMTLPTVSVPVVFNTTYRDNVPEDYISPQITVLELEQGMENKPANALPIEHVVEIGARYIEEVFGERIDGFTVVIHYYYATPYTRTQVVCSVIPSELGYKSSSTPYELYADEMFNFSLDAVTGERISISDSRVKESGTRFAFMNDKISLNEDYLKSLENDILADINIFEFERKAVEFAEKHFNFTTTVSSEYRSIRQWTLNVPVDENGNVTVARDNVTFINDTALEFSVIDERGREAIVTILTKSKQLFSIQTAHNDIVPGFNPGY